MVFRSGSYTIAGAESWQEVLNIVEWLSQVLDSVGVDIDRETISVSIMVKYLVATAELGSSVNLAAAVALGLGRTEYEPDQFPGLIYRPPGADSVVLLFASGRVVVTGSPNLDAVEQTFAAFQDELTDFLTFD